jgi:hypothetical protein
LLPSGKFPRIALAVSAVLTAVLVFVVVAIRTPATSLLYSDLAQTAIVLWAGACALYAALRHWYAAGSYSSRRCDRGSFFTPHSVRNSAEPPINIYMTPFWLHALHPNSAEWPRLARPFSGNPSAPFASFGQANSNCVLAASYASTLSTLARAQRAVLSPSHRAGNGLTCSSAVTSSGSSSGCHVSPPSI